MDLTEILQRVKGGDPQARHSLIQTAYDELRKLAAAKMSDQRNDHTLTSTALVHEVAMKLLAESQLPMGNRGQFFAYASKAMRNLLIDYARSRGAQRRGGDRQRFALDEVAIACREQSEDLLALNDALEQLEQSQSRKAQVVEMRYFGGMSNQEVASALQISVATVKRDWDVAKALLLRELSQHDDSTHAANEAVESPDES